MREIKFLSLFFFLSLCSINNVLIFLNVSIRFQVVHFKGQGNLMDRLYCFMSAPASLEITKFEETV